MPGETVSLLPAFRFPFGSDDCGDTYDTNRIKGFYEVLLMTMMVMLVVVMAIVSLKCTDNKH